ncbi:MAG: helix-turn-helix transcriptional regulator [Coprococcus sp.]|nr:helix-turn-helix transcriptional regulator [Coprococcus sp.]
MDTKRVGMFLAELRKQNNMTQEQLGEKIGVTNKTVSRWETGAYMPPVEMLEILSNLYDVSINEIVSGKKLNETEYKQQAEENMKAVLSESAFTLKDRIAFFQKKWKKEHAFELIFEMLIIVAVMICGFVFENELWIVAVIAAFVWSVWQNNRMMAFVEKYAYTGNREQQ